MANIRNNLKAYLWVIIVLLIFSFHVTDLTLDILYPAPKFAGLSTWSKIDVYYGFFTTQSNIFVVIYLIWSLAVFTINKIKNLRLEVNFYFSLAVVVYITVTLIFYWGAFAAGIFSPADNHDPNGPDLLVYQWFASIALHALIPIFMIISFLVFNCGIKNYPLKANHHRQLWLIEIYPLFYFAYCLVRGEIRLVTHQTPNTAYPYVFLDWRNFSHPLLGWLLLIAIVIFTLLIIAFFQYLYLWLNNRIYRYLQKRTKVHHAAIMNFVQKYRKPRSKKNK